jgi:hypothetical protein
MDAELAPVFVRIKDYNEVLSIVKILKKKMSSAKETLQRLHNLRDEENQELLDWSKNLEEITEKISFMDKALLDPNIKE